jgi:hypothetical protein
MFDGFTLDRIDVGATVLRVRHGGAGPAVLLLHGHPRTHSTWNKVAPLLAERFIRTDPDAFPACGERVHGCPTGSTIAVCHGDGRGPSRAG